MALGFAAYALWRLVQAVAERQDADESAAATWGKRAGYVGRVRTLRRTHVLDS